MIDLLLLGNGSMQPLPDRWLSSVLIRCGTELVLFDCGEGTQIVYRKFGWGFRKLSTIILSHMHADHVAGLPGMLLCIANAERTEPVTIFGPAGVRRVVEALRVLYPYLPFELHIHELATGDQVDLPGGMRGSVVAGMHGEMPVLAWRFDLARRPKFDRDAAEAIGVPQAAWRQLQSGEPVAWNDRVIEPAMVTGPSRQGISFGIITDTRPLESFATMMREVDLLISEATYLDHVDLHKALMFGHMTMEEACAIATEAGARRLVLTHFSATYEQPLDHADRARACFPATEIGFSGWTTTLTYPEE